jgi:murein DD-endopeptidase MepM/ murein hydrolase activator NlpD
VNFRARLTLQPPGGFGVYRLTRTIAALFLSLLATPAVAQLAEVGGGPIEIGRLDDNHAEIDAAHQRSVARARALGPLPAAALTRTPRLQFPLRLRSQSEAFRGHSIFNYVDLDATAKLKDFACGKRTYDGHNGVDIVLTPFWWRMMDAQEAEVVAAAPGKIIDKADGNYDRQCSFSGNPPANYVIIQQDDGYFAFYWHLKKGSVTGRSVGSRVAVGEFLGFVGSSGFSSGPHLHFELRTSDFGGQTVDPYAGLCGATRTLWKHQPENADTEILRVATHRLAPNPAPNWCSNPDTGYSDRFNAGEYVWVAAYLRDQTPSSPITFKVLRPDGQIFTTWTSGAVSSSFAYWYGQIYLPTGADGRWRVQVQLEGRTSEHAFMVGKGLPAPTTLTTSVSPLSATASPTDPANFDVVVRNTGATAAIGCALGPDAPLAAVSSFQITVAGIPQGAVNEVFDLAAGTAKRVRLTIKPKGTYRAQQMQIPVRVFCSNASEAAAARAKVVTLSF